MAKIGLMEIKTALNDARFRDKLPADLKDDLVKYLHCPACPANINFIRKVLKTCRKELSEYFNTDDLWDEQKELEKLSNNNWRVLNCTAQELENVLKTQLPKGRMQLAIARWEDQVTVIVNDLEYLF